MRRAVRLVRHARGPHVELLAHRTLQHELVAGQRGCARLLPRRLLRRRSRRVSRGGGGGVLPDVREDVYGLIVRGHHHVVLLRYAVRVRHGALQG